MEHHVLRQRGMSRATRWIITALSGVSMMLGSVDAFAADCSMSREQILASASGARRNAVERGFGWLDESVPYSQTASHDGYRTDCSGFVSMCWSLEASSNTSAFYSGKGNTRLGSYEDLDVADALVRQGHIMLFLGWNDDDHDGACVLEQASTASDMQFRVRTRASLEADGYKPIRATNLSGGSGTSADGNVTPQASEATGDPGDPGDADDATSSDEDESDAPHNSRRRAGSALESGGCSASPHGASTTFPLWALGLVALLRRRRK